MLSLRVSLDFLGFVLGLGFKFGSRVASNPKP